jgi:hypothetical protein
MTKSKTVQVLRHVGWMTSAGNVVTPVGARENDAKTYGWTPVYMLAEKNSLKEKK